MSETAKKPRHFVVKRQKTVDLAYWQPSKGLARLGYTTVALGKIPLGTNPPPRNEVHLHPAYAEVVQAAEAINAKVDQHRGAQPVVAKNQHGTLPWVVEQYKKDHAYKKLRPKSKKTIDWFALRLLEWSAAKGDPPMRTIKRSDAKALWATYGDKGQLTTAKHLIGVGRALWNFALHDLEDHDIVDRNPFVRLAFKAPPPRQVQWQPEQIAAAINAALIMPARSRGGHSILGYRKSIADAVMIIHNTTLREGDVLALNESNYDGHKITCVPSKTRDKTGFKFSCPVTPELKAWLDDMLAERRAGNVVSLHQQDRPLVINEATGQRYTCASFELRFREVCRAAGLPDGLWFEDLRRTAVVQLAEAGLTEAEISAFTGHSRSSVAAMMEIYCPTNIKMAEHGMAKLLEYRSRITSDG
jgi:hypothetical protein